MRISELAERCGVSVATLKFYLREGMLHKGVPTSATQATYDDVHLARVRLITALASVGGLPLARVRDVLAVLDDPGEDPIQAMGRAVDALPPYVDADADHPRAREVLEALGITYTPEFTATAQLEVSLRALADAGLDHDPATIERYWRAMLTVAEDEIAPLTSGEVDDPIPYAVLGTALYEPVLLALRRLAHLHVLTTSAAPSPEPTA